MQLTLHADYAFRVLLYLGTQPANRPVRTEEISRAYKISKHHLVRVVRTLSREGFVLVHPGRSGGVKLAREAHLISLGDVMRRVETNLQVVECFDMATNTCPIVPACLLKPILGEALGAFIGVLDKYTLADLLDARHGKGLARIFAIQH